VLVEYFLQARKKRWLAIALGEYVVTLLQQLIPILKWYPTD